MAPEQIALVQTGFARLAPEADAVAAAFYTRLFQIDLALRALFPGELGPQRIKLMQMLAAVVRGLDDLPALLPTLKSLGARHARYGARPQHYGTVGRVLMDTLASGLGSAFTAPMEEAWSAAYTTLAAAMQAHAETAPPSAISARL